MCCLFFYSDSRNTAWPLLTNTQKNHPHELVIFSESNKIQHNQYCLILKWIILMSWIFLVNLKNIQCACLIPEQITLMSWSFSVNQKHSTTIIVWFLNESFLGAISSWKSLSQCIWQVNKRSKKSWVKTTQPLVFWPSL